MLKTDPITKAKILLTLSGNLDELKVDDPGRQHELISSEIDVDTFPYWFKKHKLHYDYHTVRILALRFNKYFELWWDPRKVPLDEFASILCTACSDKFELWWDPKKFPYEQCCSYLLYCWEHKETWWDNNPYFQPTSGFVSSLAKCFNWCFDEWWKPELLRVADVSDLAKYCSEHFDKWWNPNQLCRRLEQNEVRYLIKYCSNHFDKWKVALPQRIDNDAVIIWLATQHPKDCQGIHAFCFELRTLIRIIQSCANFTTYEITREAYNQLRELSKFDSPGFTKIQAMLKTTSSRHQEFIRKLKKRGLYPVKNNDNIFHPNVLNYSKETVLILLTEFRDYFDIWWDPEEFPWEDCSKDLCKYAPDKFLLWWNPNHFCKKDFWALAKYCSEYMHIWIHAFVRHVDLDLWQIIDKETWEQLKIMTSFDMESNGAEM